MKYTLLLLFGIALLLGSCNGGCDMDSAKGAADCYCAMSKGLMDAQKDDDYERVEQIQEEMNMWMDELDRRSGRDEYSIMDVVSEMDGNEDCDQ